MSDDKAIKLAIDNAVADVVDASLGGKGGPRTKLMAELVGIVFNQVVAHISGVAQSDWMDESKDDSWVRKAAEGDALAIGDAKPKMDFNKLQNATQKWWESIQNNPGEVLKAVMRFHPEKNDIPDRYFRMLQDKSPEEAAIEDEASKSIMKFYEGAGPVSSALPATEAPTLPASPPHPLTPPAPKEGGEPKEKAASPEPSLDGPPAVRKPSDKLTEFDTSEPDSSKPVPGLPAEHGL